MLRHFVQIFWYPLFPLGITVLGVTRILDQATTTRVVGTSIFALWTLVAIYNWRSGGRAQRWVQDHRIGWLPWLPLALLSYLVWRLTTVGVSTQRIAAITVNGAWLVATIVDSLTGRKLSTWLAED